MKLIDAQHISHSYNGKDLVLDDICLTIRRGEFLSILGASGSGKTTLLSVLGGIERPTSGKVFVDGEDICAANESRRAVLRRTKIGFVFQFFNLAPYLTVEQNILVPILLGGKGKKSVAERLDKLLSVIGLEDRRNSLPGKLSGGEQQRVAIARGLICGPDAILLDAPCSSERHVIQSAQHLAMWSPSRPKRLAIEQYSLLASAFMALRKGGHLLYSTCSVNPQEDEAVVAKLFTRQNGLVEEIMLDDPRAEKREHGCIIMPDSSGGLGPLYYCLLRKICNHGHSRNHKMPELQQG